MRHTRLFRLMAGLFGVWFTFTLIQPNGMMGMTMDGSGASMNMSSGQMPSMNMAGISKPDMNMTTMQHTSAVTAETSSTDQPATPVECDQHDCCCSALSPISSMPLATLAWLPEQVINQETPQAGDCVVEADGQLLLPFANGPPRTVSA